VDRTQQAIVEEHQPAIAAIGALPVIDSARADAALGFALPDLPAGGRIERGNPGVAALDIHHAVGDDRIELRRGTIAGLVFPGNLKLPDIALVDLRERRILRALGPAEVLIPPHVIE